METVNALKIRNNLGQVLDLLREKGEPILVLLFHLDKDIASKCLKSLDVKNRCYTHFHCISLQNVTM